MHLLGILPLKLAVLRTAAATFRFASHSSSTCWAGLTLVGRPPRVRLPALEAPLAMHHQYGMVRIEHGLNDGVKTSVVLTGEAGHKPG